MMKVCLKSKNNTKTIKIISISGYSARYNTLSKDTMTILKNSNILFSTVFTEKTNLASREGGNELKLTDIEEKSKVDTFIRRLKYLFSDLYTKSVTDVKPFEELVKQNYVLIERIK